MEPLSDPLDCILSIRTHRSWIVDTKPCALLHAPPLVISLPPLLQPLDPGGQQQLVRNILSNIAVYRAHGIHDVIALMDQVGGGRESEQA